MDKPPKLVALILPFTLVPAFLAGPEMKSFDSVSMECEPSSQIPELFAFGAIGVMAAGAMWLTFRLRVACVQVGAAVITLFLSFRNWCGRGYCSWPWLYVLLCVLLVLCSAILGTIVLSLTPFR